MWCRKRMIKKINQSTENQKNQSLNGEVICVKISVDLVVLFASWRKSKTQKDNFSEPLLTVHHIVVSIFSLFVFAFSEKNKSLRYGTLFSFYKKLSDPKGDNLRANYISAEWFRKVWCYAILSSDLFEQVSIQKKTKGNDDDRSKMGERVSNFRKRW